MPRDSVKYRVQVCFLLDATASMTPLLDSAKEACLELPATLQDVATDLGATNTDFQYACVTYRDFDSGEQHWEVTDFEADMSSVHEHLSRTTADGGGDFPEDILGALENGVLGLSWSSDRGVIRLLVHFTDAPNHGPDWVPPGVTYSDDHPETGTEELAAEVLYGLADSGIAYALVGMQHAGTGFKDYTATMAEKWAKLYEDAGGRGRGFHKLEITRLTKKTFTTMVRLIAEQTMFSSIVAYQRTRTLAATSSKAGAAHRHTAKLLAITETGERARKELGDMTFKLAREKAAAEAAADSATSDATRAAAEKHVATLEAMSSATLTALSEAALATSAATAAAEGIEAGAATADADADNATSFGEEVTGSLLGSDGAPGFLELLAASAAKMKGAGAGRASERASGIPVHALD